MGRMAWAMPQRCRWRRARASACRRARWCSGTSPTRSTPRSSAAPATPLRSIAGFIPASRYVLIRPVGGHAALRNRSSALARTPALPRRWLVYSLSITSWRRVCAVCSSVQQLDGLVWLFALLQFPLRTKTDQEIQRFVAMEEDCIKQETGVATGS